MIEDKNKSTIDKEKIEDVWNTDIFPLWDRHWDYKHKKPKEKGYIARGLEAICSCWQNNDKNDFLNKKSNSTGLKMTDNVLESLWKYGLPPPSRKTLWPLVIGNNLFLTPVMIEDIRKRKVEVNEFRHFGLEEEIKEVGEMLITLRPDLPPVRDLFLLSKVFTSVFPKDQATQAFNCLGNFIHSFHFLSFYRGDKSEIELRIQLF